MPSETSTPSASFSVVRNLRQRLHQPNPKTPQTPPPIAQTRRPVGRAARLLMLIHPPPSAGRVEVFIRGLARSAPRRSRGHRWKRCPLISTGGREPERSEGRTPGQGLFGYFCGCLTKVPRCKSETRKKPLCIEWICTQESITASSQLAHHLNRSLRQRLQA